MSRHVHVRIGWPRWLVKVALRAARALVDRLEPADDPGWRFEGITSACGGPAPAMRSGMHHRCGGCLCECHGPT